MKTTKQTRRQIDVNKLVGRNEYGDYYWLNCVFEDGKDFQGATGSVLCPITTAQKEERMRLDNAKDWLKELWREQVKAGQTEESLDDFVQTVIDTDGDEAFFDLSDYNNGLEIAKIYNSELPTDADESEKAEFCECIGGGRCFNHKIKWAKIYDEAALKLALEYEKD